MYMAYMIQQRPHQISTENLAYHKRISVAEDRKSTRLNSSHIL